MNYITAIPQHSIDTLFIETLNFRKHESRSPKINSLLFSEKSAIFRWSKSKDVVHKLIQRGYTNDQEWVVKFPFKTNHDDMKYCKGFAALEAFIVRMFDDYDTGAHVPYAMIQPRLSNQLEYKVILLNGIANHCFTYTGGSGTAFCPTPEQKKTVLFAFAENCLKTLKERRPGTIDEGLVRVDIMQDDNGKMVVNEFESFEAVFHSTGEKEMKVHTCLINFWQTHLNKLYDKCLSKRKRNYK
jgi:hypothetical protein